MPGQNQTRVQPVSPSLILILCGLLWATGCSEDAPSYCDNNTPCPQGTTCDLPTKTCLPAAQDSGFKEAGPDAAADGAPEARPEAGLDLKGEAGPDKGSPDLGSPNGAPCKSSNQCTSGNCVDKHCCDVLCDGACRSCDQAGKQGTCSLIPKGTDPDNECAGTPALCGGTCDGIGVCAFAPLSTSCGATTCTAGSLSTHNCDGKGGCPPKTQSCGGYACENTGDKCKTTCMTKADCSGNAQCVGKQCVSSLPRGKPCGTNNKACASGFCVDGVCCKTATCPTCTKCNITSKEGTCNAVINSTPCGATTCADGPTSSAKTIKACVNGKCTLSTTLCNFYRCNSKGDDCLSACAGHSDCTVYGYCAGVTCTGKKNNGATCTDSAQCLSKICHATEKVCCASACTAECETCSLPASKGSCKPKLAGTPCNKPLKCVNAAQTSYIEKQQCDGKQSTCQPVKDKVCDPYRCTASPAQCRTSCVKNSECSAGLCDLFTKKNTCPLEKDICYVDKASTIKPITGARSNPYTYLTHCVQSTALRYYVLVKPGNYVFLPVDNGHKYQMVASEMPASVFDGDQPKVFMQAKGADGTLRVEKGSELILAGMDISTAIDSTSSVQILNVSKLTLNNCLVRKDPKAVKHPDYGIWNTQGSTLIVQDSRIINFVKNGIYSEDSTVSLERVRLEGNGTNGIHFKSTSTSKIYPLSVDQVLATGNKGNGVAVDTGLATIDRLRAWKNGQGASSNTGYGLYLSNAAGSLITNLLSVHNNNGLFWVDGISCTVCPTTRMVNATIARSTHSEMFCPPGSQTKLEVTNSIVHNTAGTIVNGNSCTFTYSNVAGGATGTGNVNVSPKFVDPGSAMLDFHLQKGSQCIDAGDSAATSLPATDLDGKARIKGAKVDMGAYELQ